ncbi:DNA-directed RNA polymerase [Aureococcus anophagefferens]|nr:DNA-directed RNA polymerase [Aureococcus anophagefferens]
MRRLLALAPRRPHVLRPLRPKSTAPNALSALAEDELLLPAPTIALRSGNDDAVSSTALVAAEREREALERHALYERQLELEEETLGARADYEAMIEDLLSLGKGAELKPVQRLMAQWYEPLVTRITAERKATLDGDKGGDLRIYGPLLLLLPPEQLAVLTMHTTIGLCLKHGPLGAKYSNLVTTLGETVQAEARVLKLRNLRRERLKAAEDAEGKRAVPKTFLDARALARLPTHVVNSRAKRALEEGDDTDWPTITRAKLGSALVMALLDVAKDDAGSPLLEHTIVYSNARKIGIIRAKDELLSHALPETIPAAMPRFLPMLVEPRRWRAYDEGGFLRLRAVAMRTHGCALQMEAFRNARGIEGGVLAGLDAMGKVPWAVNGPVFDLVKAAWASGGKWPDLPSQEDLALPEPMDLAEALARADGDEDGGKKLYDAHLRRSARLKRRNAELHSLRCDTLLKLGIAEQFKDEAAFYFPYNVDFRGRAYPVPPNLNHLGSDSLDDRAAFAVAHEADIRDAYERPMDGNMWWLEADEPWQALAACRELARAAELDEPRDYECALPVHADGSCNGLQHYAALGRDHEGGRQRRARRRRPRAKERGRRAWTDEDEALETVRLAQIVDGLITRKVVKQTVMTSVYGVTFVGARQQILGASRTRSRTSAQDPSPERDAAVARLTTLGCITPEGDVDEAELYCARATWRGSL